MAKIGLSIKIDVTKIDKSRLFKGEKGTYLNLTTVIDPDNPSKYGDHGFVSQSLAKEERDQKVKAPIIGNAKVFFKEGQQSSADDYRAASGGMNQDFDDDVPGF